MSAAAANANANEEMLNLTPVTTPRRGDDDEMDVNSRGIPATRLPIIGANGLPVLGPNGLPTTTPVLTRQNAQVGRGGKHRKRSHHHHTRRHRKHKTRRTHNKRKHRGTRRR